MRNKLLLAVFTFSLMGLAAQAQTALKIGYADVEYILSKMPEAKQVQADLEATNTQLQNQLQSKIQEYEQKLQAYQQGAATMLDAVRQDKEAELTQLQQRIQKFQTDAQTSLQEKQAKLMQPLYEKLGNTIEALAKEESFTHILNGQLGGVDIVLYADEKYDVSDKILKKMGVEVAAN
ncbi:MAG: OmpH family outer membrane protein [Bacteroidota bacterium]